MNRAKGAAWFNLGLTALYLNTPGGGPQLDDPPEPELPDSLPQAVHAAAPDSGPVVEPPMRAVDGFVLITYHSGGTERFYVSRSPDFIADKIRAGMRDGLPVVEFWAKPGYPDSGLRRVFPTLVREVRVQHLEPDLNALFDFTIDDYVL